MSARNFIGSPGLRAEILGEAATPRGPSLRLGPAALRGVALARIAFGLVWAVDATLKFLPGFVHESFLGTLHHMQQGQPAAVHWWIGLFIGAFSTGTSAWAYTLGVVEALIALAMLAGALTNLVCVLGGILALGIWATGEGFGGPYQSGTTDIGASIMYVFVFALLALAAAGSTWGLDAWLRPRLGRFGWLCSRLPHAAGPRSDAG